MADLAASTPAPAIHADPALTGPLADAQTSDKDALAAARTEKRSAVEAKIDRKAEILAELEKSKAKARTEATVEEKKTEAAKAPKPAPTGDLAQVAKLSAEVRNLKAELAKFADKKPGESKADLIAALKKDPGLIFTELADEPELMVKLAEARQKQLAAMDPREREIAELKDKQKAIEDKLSAADLATKEAKDQLDRKNVYDVTDKLLQEGQKDEAGKVLFDHTPFNYCRAFTAAGEVDAPGLAMEATTEMIRELGRKPTDAETATLLTIAYEKTESRLKKWAQISRDVEAKAKPSGSVKTEAKERPQERRPPTIVSAMGRGGNVPVMRAPESKKDRKAAILQRYATIKRQEVRS